MSQWVDIRNFDALMRDCESRDGTMTTGLATYLKKIIEQNEMIILLLTSLNQK